MSYESTVIANGVDALWPLDELVADHSSSVAQLTDISGNSRPALCFPDDPLHPERHVHNDPALDSPIITAPSAAVMSGRIGAIVDPVNRLDDFAWQGWLYNADTTAPNAMICRSGHFASSGSNIMGYGAGSDHAVAQLYIGTTSHTLQAPVSLNAWHYLVLNKTSSLIQLWVDACLGQEISATGDINVQTYTEFHLGSQQGVNTTIWYSRGVNYLGIGPSLTQTKIIQNYEAAGYTTDCEEAVPGFRYNCPSV